MSESARAAARKPPRAALGFRAHSSWAAAVALGGPPSAPVVLRRWRVELIELGVPKQPYHAARALSLPQARQLVVRSQRAARRLAVRALRSVLAELRGEGYEVAGCGVLQAAGRPLPGLAQILSSHPLLHTAEGELFRNALAFAGERFELPVLRVSEREVEAQAAGALGLPPAQLRRRLQALGKPLGSPWTQDQKLAAAVAWLALRRWRAA